jgi:hypothetical protein
LTIDFISPAGLQNQCAAFREEPALLSLSAKLHHLLQSAPSEKQDELRELCHWLICCKNLWPEAEYGTHEQETPFNLTDDYQLLRADPDAVQYAVHGMLRFTAEEIDILAQEIHPYIAPDSLPQAMQDIFNRHDEENTILALDILAYVETSGSDDWQTLRRQRHPASLIDPKSAPGEWPKEYLAWAVRTMNMEEANLEGADLSDTDLRGIRFDRVNLKYADFSGSDISHAVFEHCDLAQTILNRTDMTYSDFFSTSFLEAKLDRAKFLKTQITLCNFQGADMRECTFSSADMQTCDMSDAALKGIFMQEADLRYIKVDSSSLNSAYLPASYLSGADRSADPKGRFLTSYKYSDLINKEGGSVDGSAPVLNPEMSISRIFKLALVGVLLLTSTY